MENVWKCLRSVKEWHQLLGYIDSYLSWFDLEKHTYRLIDRTLFVPTGKCNRLTAQQYTKTAITLRQQQHNRIKIDMKYNPVNSMKISCNSKGDISNACVCVRVFVFLCV